LKAVSKILSVACLIFSIPLSVIAQQPSIDKADSIRITTAITPGPPGNIVAVDKPDDRGGAVNVSWDKAPGDDKSRLVTGYLVYRSESPEGGFELISSLPAGSTDFGDSDGLKNGVNYYYKVASVYKADTLTSAISQAAVPRPQWFQLKLLAVFIFMLLFSGATVALIFLARKGRSLYVRPIAGIDAVDDAIGRATEMGKPILFVPGLGEASRVATIAAFTILARVAKKVAEYQTRIIVPNYDPVVMTICQEVVREAYTSAGRPEAFDPKDVYFVTQDQFPYTASVNGTMLREKPATNFYMGMFYAESLILAETGFITGSIQIAGTDQLIQIPFFVVACDYTLMGEELYAASAYLSQDPQQLGTLKAQDWGKLAAVILMIAGAIVYLFNTGAGDLFMAWIRSE
jgi:hypothetical protein